MCPGITYPGPTSFGLNKTKLGKPRYTILTGAGGGRKEVVRDLGDATTRHGEVSQWDWNVLTGNDT